MRTIKEIAVDIVRIWSQKGKGVGYAAKPYLDAMLTLNNSSDDYGCDDGVDIVLHFLSNATSFRGPEAKALKEELKLHLPKGYR